MSVHPRLGRTRESYLFAFLVSDGQVSIDREAADRAGAFLRTDPERMVVFSRIDINRCPSQIWHLNMRRKFNMSVAS